jgi:putative intracellular protease/amidase
VTRAAAAGRTAFWDDTEMATVLVPIPERDFDPSEVAVSWRVLKDLGHDFVFATPDGAPGTADEMMVTGAGLDPWGFVPGLGRLALLGRFVRADGAGRRAYAELIADKSFQNPSRWEDVSVESADALLLPGGHRARGMRRYLESEVLQRLVGAYFAADRPVAAICHGVLLAARSVDEGTARSVLYGRRTTALTWQLERKGWQLTRFTRFWDPSYFRTYLEAPGQPIGYMSVQQEVTRALAAETDFLDVPKGSPDYRAKTNGRVRDALDDDRPAFVVSDGKYVSGRWPGDTHTFAATFAKLLDEPAHLDQLAPPATDLD